MSESQRKSAPDVVIPGEAGPRIIAAVARRLAPEVSLALRAAHQMRARPAIVVAVLLLASFGFGGRVVAREMMLRRSGAGYRDRQLRIQSFKREPTLSFVQRWLMAYQHRRADGLVLEPLVAFCHPLHQPTDLAAGDWIILILSPLGPRMTALPSWRAALYAVPVMALITAAAVLILVGLLGWIKEGKRWLAAAGLRRYLSAYYAPVLAVALVGFVGYSLLLVPTYIPSWRAWIFDTPPAYLVWLLLMRALGVALMLAPFVVVVCGMGARSAIVEGWRLPGRHWLTLVSLFVLFRVGYEVLSVWEAAAPWTAYRTLVRLNLPGPLMWSWVHDLGLALLGLWVAYAFVEIAKYQATAPTGTGLIGAADDGAVGRIHGLGDAAMKGNTIEG